MGFVAPFVPLISAGVGALGGIFGGKKAQASAEKGSPQMQAAQTGATGAATTLGSQGSTLFNTGTGLIKQGTSTLSQPSNYFSALLSGNRALQSQAIAAPRAAITDTYAGAARSLEESGVRGAARDQAKADLSKQRAGQIGSLITGVQPGAASALTGIGGTQIGAGTSVAGTGTSATAGSGNIFSNLLGINQNQAQFATQQGNQFGSNFGSFLFDILNGMGKGKGGGGGRGMPDLTSGLYS